MSEEGSWNTQIDPFAFQMEDGLSTFFLFAAILILVLAIFVFRILLRHQMRKPAAFQRDVLLVTMAKEAEEQAEKEEAETARKHDFKEAIAVAENLYASFLGSAYTHDWSYYKYRFLEFWSGYHRHISLEIVAEEGLIKFYVVTPCYLTEYVEQQIQAIYPTSNVEKTTDYNIFLPTSKVYGTYLHLSQDIVLPILTYRNMEADPLEGITNTLSKVSPDEGVALQFLLRPAKPKWRARASLIAKKMHEGKSFAEAAKGKANLIDILFLVFEKTVGFIVHELFSSGSEKEEEKTKEKEQQRGLSSKNEEIVKLIEENNAKPWFECNLRLICSANTGARAKALLRNVIGSFAQFTQAKISNSFGDAFVLSQAALGRHFISRDFSDLHKVVLSTEELASIYHFPLPFSETPNIAWLAARTAPPPVKLPKEGIVLGKTYYRSRERLVRIKREDRRRHIYIIGKSGMGKSVLLEQMARQDIENGEGVCFIDPHGDTVNHLLASIPSHRIDDVIYFDPADTERPIGLNMLEAGTDEEMDFATQEMIAIFYQLVTDPAMIGPLFEHNMRNAMYTLMMNTQHPGTIADIPRIFTDTEFQKYSLKFVTDPVVRAFWEQEMAKTTDFHKSEMLGYLISKVGRFVENALMRNIIGQAKSGFDLHKVMQEKKILLVNLSKGQIGETNSNLLGLIIVSKLQMAALRRARLPEDQRGDFYLYIDEFQNYITDSIATILSEARKYRLNLTIGHQYIKQLVKNNDSKIRDAVFGNAGTMISFRIGIEDAEFLAKEFAPTINAYDLVNAERYHSYIKLLVDNQATRAFTMETLAPSRGDPVFGEKLKQLSRLRYGRDGKIVANEILERTKLGRAAQEGEA